MHVYYACKKCEEEMSVNVRLGSSPEDDLPERCEKCGAPIPEEAHAEVYNDADEKSRAPFPDEFL